MMSASGPFPDDPSDAKSPRKEPPLETPTAWTLEELAVVWNFYRRRWWVIGCCTLLSLAVAVLIICIRGAEYRVSALLYFKLGAELAPPPTLNREQVLITRRKEDVNNELEILKSPHLLHEVVQDLGEEFFQDPPAVGFWSRTKQFIAHCGQRANDIVEEALIAAGLRKRLTQLQQIEVALRERLQAETLRDTDVVSVTLRTPEPEAGVMILDMLLEGYVRQHLAAHQETGVKAFFANQARDLQQRLAESEQALLSFQTTRSLWSADGQRSDLLESRRTVELAAGASQARIASLTKEVEVLQSLISETPATIEVSSTKQLNPAMQDVEDRLASLMLDEAVVSTAYAADSREVRDRRAQISRLQARRQREPERASQARTMGINPSREALVRSHALKKAELEGLHGKAAAELRQLQSLDVRLQGLETASSELNRLRRERDLLERNYTLYAENLEKSRITAVMNEAAISNLKVISAPTATMVPSSPRLKPVLAAATFVGIALGSLVGLGLELSGARTRGRK